MAWRPVERPLVPWGKTVNKIMLTEDLPALDGSLIYLVSDSSGAHKESRYIVSSVLYCDVEASKEWFITQRSFRRQFLHDGRRMSFKALNDRKRQAGFLPFLQAAFQISGVLASFIVDKSVTQIAGGRAAFDNPNKSTMLKGRWSAPMLEEMSRITHFAGLLVGGFAKPNQNIYWISDEDALFDTPGRKADIAKMMSGLANAYIPFELGELGVGTAAIDEGDRIEEDLAAIPDLVAGALCEGFSKQREQTGRGMPHKVAVPFDIPFTLKSEIIWDWLSEPSGPLKRITFLVENAGNGDFLVSRFDIC